MKKYMTETRVLPEGRLVPILVHDSPDGESEDTNLS